MILKEMAFDTNRGIMPQETAIYFFEIIFPPFTNRPLWYHTLRYFQGGIWEALWFGKNNFWFWIVGTWIVGREEKRMRWLDGITPLHGHKSGQTPGVGGGQGSLAYCSPWGHKESDTTERLNNNNKIWICDWSLKLSQPGIYNMYKYSFWYLAKLIQLCSLKK